MYHDLCHIEPGLLVSILAANLNKMRVDLLPWIMLFLVKVWIVVTWGILLQKQMRILVRPRPGAVFAKQSYLFIVKYLVILKCIVSKLVHLIITSSICSLLRFLIILLPQDDWLNAKHPRNADKAYNYKTN